MSRLLSRNGPQTAEATSVSKCAAPRGVALVLMLMVLMLFCVGALVWTTTAQSHSAQARVFQADMMLTDVVRSGLEHARAELSVRALDPRAPDPVTLASNPGSDGWVSVMRDRDTLTRYRFTLADNSAVPAARLPWPATDARRTARVLPRGSHWRAVLDPRVASLAEITEACREELASHGLPETYAERVALTLADEHDRNTALGTAPDDRNQGFEGLSIAAVQRGDERIVPVSQFLRLADFYNPEEFYHAFTINAVDPVPVGATGRTNSRVRLSEAPFAPGRYRDIAARWRTFQRLWSQVSSHRFVPHAWQDVRARITYECGGHTDTLRILDNDTNYLYFAGYPLAECVKGRFVQVDLCNERDVPGTVSAQSAGLDVWIVTGVMPRTTYAFSFDGDAYEDCLSTTALTGDDHSLRRLPDDSDCVTGTWQYVTTSPGADDDCALVFQARYTNGLSVAALQLRQPDHVVLRNCSSEPRYVSGWRWLRHCPELGDDGVEFDHAWLARAGRSLPAEQDFTLAPGALWWWTTDLALLPRSAEGLVSQIPLDRAGPVFTVASCSQVASPLGGVGWDLQLQVHPDYPWEPRAWEGAVLRCVNGAHADPARAYLIVSSGRRSLRVHVGSAYAARSRMPQRGSRVRIGSLSHALRRTSSVIANALGQPSAALPALRRAPPRATWAEQQHDRWVTGRAPTPEPPPSRYQRIDSHGADGSVWRELSAVAGERGLSEFIGALEQRINPYGVVCSTADAVSFAGHGWSSTALQVNQTGARSWRINSSGNGWPRDFWRNLTLAFPAARLQARIVASGGSRIFTDRALSPGSDAACVAPGLDAPMYVTTAAQADGVWEWRVPASVGLPAQAYLLGFADTGTNIPAHYSVWLWDARHGRWDAAGVDATYSQHDTLALGQILARHISTNSTVRVRVSADRTHAWVRGLQLVSDVECGKPNRLTASRGTLAAELDLPPDASDVPDALHALTVDRSDAYTVQLEAEVLRGNEVIARRQGIALLAREWEADGADLRPTVRIERWQPGRF